jgi:hypothetical protein
MDQEPLDISDPANLRNSLSVVIQETVGTKDLGDDDDFFAVLGMDSLQVLSLSRRLLKGFPSQPCRNAQVATTSLIYRNPTLVRLEHAILEFIKTIDQNDHGYMNGPQGNASVAQELMEKYAVKLPRYTNGGTDTCNQPKQERHVVLLTGSTGSLGSYVLDELIRSPVVEHVWCLNRSSGAEGRQRTSNRARGLATDFDTNKVHFRQVNLSREYLGLDRSDYSHLLDNVTHIIRENTISLFNLLANF